MESCLAIITARGGSKRIPRKNIRTFIDRPILQSLKVEDGLLKMNWPEYSNSRSQDLAPAFHDSGQFYFFKTEAFLKTKKLFMDFTIPLEVPESEVQDIDTEEDWKIAELKYS